MVDLKREFIDQETGHSMREYQNGMIRDMQTARIVKPPNTSVITSENASDYHRMRREKKERMIRNEILEKQNRLSANDPKRIRPASNAIEAIAISAGLLWEEIVLNQKAYARDRLQAYQEMTREAGMSNSKNGGENPGNSNPNSNQILILIGQILENRIQEKKE